MENSYGIGVTNRYALFLDEDADPLEVLKVQEQEKELKKKSKVAEKENKGKSEVAPKTKVTLTQRKTIKDAPNHKPQDIKRDDNKAGPKPNTDLKTKFHNSADNREERNNKRNREDRPFNNGPSEGNNREERPRRDFGSSDTGDVRTRGRGGLGRPRGGRGTGRIYDQRGKREFDRQSGSDKTGVKPVDKREGGGAHNWGSHKDIIEEVDKSEIDPSWGDMSGNGKEDVPKEQTETKEAVPEGGDAPVAEEEPKQFTLDEWRAQKAGRQKPQYNLRKAGEGEDPTQWKKMYELSKKKEGEEEDTDDEEYDASEYPQRVGRQKHILDIDIHFNDTRRGGVGGRGRGRSGPRGQRGGSGAGGGSGGGGGGRGDGVGSGGGGGVGVGGGGGGVGGGNGGGSGGGGGGDGGPPRGERVPRERQGPRPFRGAGAAGGGPTGTSGPTDEVEDHMPRQDHQHKGGRQNAPKVDDEHDFPSLS